MRRNATSVIFLPEETHSTITHADVPLWSSFSQIRHIALLIKSVTQILPTLTETSIFTELFLLLFVVWKEIDEH